MAQQSSNPAAASGGLLSFCSNCKISTKIFAGFSCLLVIIAIISLMAYRAFSGATEMFEAYAQRVEVVGISQDVDREYINLRRFVREFANTGDEKAFAGAGKQRALLKDATAKALQTIKNPERLAKMREISGLFDAYNAWRRQSSRRQARADQAGA